MLSIKDIARLAGVSPATVSRVVNQKQYVKSEIRERVLALVKETGYVPNNAARSMVLKRTFTIGIVIPDAFNMFQRQLFATIEHYLEGFGYRTSFFFVKWEPESELRCMRRLKGEKLDGIIMIHEVRHPDFYEYPIKRPCPSCSVHSIAKGWTSPRSTWTRKRDRGQPPTISSDCATGG